jgi:hypothetical protein
MGIISPRRSARSNARTSSTLDVIGEINAGNDGERASFALSAVTAFGRSDGAMR